jgi:hypothetical protein
LFWSAVESALKSAWSFLNEFWEYAEFVHVFDPTGVMDILTISRLTYRDSRAGFAPTSARFI